MNDISKYLTHKPPMIVLDEISSLDLEARKCKCLKTLRADEFWVVGHFPAPIGPTFPGYLMLEGIGQAAIVVMNLLHGRVAQPEDKFFAMTFTSFRLFKSATVNDTLEFEVEILNYNKASHFVEFCGEVRLNNELVAKLKHAIGYCEFSNGKEK